MPDLSHDLKTHGFAIVPRVVHPYEQADLLNALGPVTGAGRRGLLAIPEVAGWARAESILSLIRPHLPAEPRPVRSIYFDKSADANWLVPWHQDLTIAVREQKDVRGFGPWSSKDGIPHVQPPIELLEQMITVRLHLDHADETNGALRVLPGSHGLGRLSVERIQELRSGHTEHLCTASAGDALIMRPLLLHASSRSTSPKHRRILHLEYAAFALPGGLQWDEAA